MINTPKEAIPKTKYSLMGYLFLICVCTFLVFGLLLPDKSISEKERRHLHELPTFQTESVLEGDYFSKLESYLLDHFPMRDQFRSVKNAFDLTFLQKKDADGYFKIDGSLYELPTEFHTENILSATNGFSEIMTTYFPSSNGYYCIIPDKTFYLSENHGYPRADYDKFITFIDENVHHNIKRIDISQKLTLEHYYSTDMHWRQEALPEIAAILSASMSNTPIINSQSYGSTLLSDNFYGGISSASGLYPAPDKLICVSSSAIQTTTMYDYEVQAEVALYQTDKISGLDLYDVYLGGAKALLELRSESEKSGKELVLFRDSFGSSIAPLLLEYYDKIYLVDLRYVSADSAMSLISPNADCDVLFLYSMDVLNSGSLRMKVV